MKFCALLRTGFGAIGPLPTCAPLRVGVSVHATNLSVQRVGPTNCETVCIGKRTGRVHFSLARITDVRSILGGKGGVEESVTNVKLCRWYL